MEDFGYDLEFVWILISKYEGFEVRIIENYKNLFFVFLLIYVIDWIEKGNILLK